MKLTISSVKQDMENKIYAVIDTNVLVSALLTSEKQSNPLLVLKAITDENGIGFTRVIGIIEIKSGNDKDYEKTIGLTFCGVAYTNSCCIRICTTKAQGR